LLLNYRQLIDSCDAARQKKMKRVTEGKKTGMAFPFLILLTATARQLFLFAVAANLLNFNRE